MCRRAGHRLQQYKRGRGLFPESIPPPLNYSVVTGKLLEDPRPGNGPGGDPVTLLEIEFPVAHPEHPRLLWCHTVYDVEVPGDVGGRDLEELRRDAPVLVAGQLSERLTLEDGRMSRRAVILANLIKSGSRPEKADPPR